MSNPKTGIGSPSSWVTRFANLIPAGEPILDLAAGGGRHTRYLLGRGYKVVAVDRNLDGMADISAEPRLELLQADLEADAWPLNGRSFGGIIVTNYLHRPLLARLAESLGPGGVLIYETFAVGQEAYGRPSNPDFLLRPNELIEAFRSSLTTLAFEHGVVDGERPSVIQRIVAARQTA